MREENQLPTNLIRLEPNEEKKSKEDIESVKEKKLPDETLQNQENQTGKEQGLTSKTRSSKHPKITSIQTQKRKGRYNIFLDGKYAFPVDEALIVKHLLRKGMEVPPELQNQLKTEDQYRKAYSRATNYLSYGLRSEKEVRDDLIEHEFEEYAEAVIEKLKEQRYVNDEEYAKAYVRTASNLNRKGPRVIQNDLYKRGINEFTIQNALPEYPFEDQVDNAVHLANKQWKKTKNKSEREAVQKIRQYLMKKGYEREVLDVALETIDTEKEEEEEYEALKLQGNKAWKRYKRKASGYELLQKIRAYLYGKGYPKELINQFIDEKEEEE